MWGWVARVVEVSTKVVSTNGKQRETVREREATRADGRKRRDTKDEGHNSDASRSHDQEKDDLNAPFTPKSNPVLSADGDGGPKLLTL